MKRTDRDAGLSPHTKPLLEGNESAFDFSLRLLVYLLQARCGVIAKMRAQRAYLCKNGALCTLLNVLQSTISRVRNASLNSLATKLH